MYTGFCWYKNNLIYRTMKKSKTQNLIDDILTIYYSNLKNKKPLDLDYLYSCSIEDLEKLIINLK